MTTLVVRSNYGDDSIALIEHLRQAKRRQYERVIVVYIDTGWAAESWQKRVDAGQTYVQKIGFEAVKIKSDVTFEALVADRKAFPSKKFQWCAGFLKGIPLINWLDEHDSQGLWHIAIPKRQARYRKLIPENIEECEYHGDRFVCHPLIDCTDDQMLQLVEQAGFEPTYTRSKECDPCTNSGASDLQTLEAQDLAKTLQLENKIDANMFGSRRIDQYVVQLKQSQSKKVQSLDMDAFSMGCGDPFGCGL